MLLLQRKTAGHKNIYGIGFFKLEFIAWTKEKTMCFPVSFRREVNKREQLLCWVKVEEPVAEIETLLAGKCEENQEHVLLQ